MKDIRGKGETISYELVFLVIIALILSGCADSNKIIR